LDQLSAPVAAAAERAVAIILEHAGQPDNPPAGTTDAPGTEAMA
jgi:hypothetical protein